MPNWCMNSVLIRGPSEVVKKYKESLLRDSTGQYYPWFSSIPLPELKDEAEVDSYVKEEYENKTLFRFHYRAVQFEVIEKSPESLELKFWTAYNKATNLCADENLFLELSIVHKYVEPMAAYHGFAHYVKGELIASGQEVSESWEMYDYVQPGPDSLDEELKDFCIIPVSELREIHELQGEEEKAAMR
jgi:hypothetical protein